MNTFIFTLAATILIAALSGSGMLFLKIFHRRFDKMLLVLVALSAGAMLGNAMFHLLPEIVETTESSGFSVTALFGIVTASFVASFLFEQLFRWHHCHSASHHGDEKTAFHCHSQTKPVAHLVLVSDAIHNFVDGLIIGTAMVVSPVLGVSTATAVALHEIPQEIGDFAVLLHGGFSRTRAFWLNLLSASTVIVGGVIGVLVSASVAVAVPVLLPIAAGSFLYIATSDLLPELKHEEDARETALHFFVFLGALLLMAALAFAE